MGGPEYARFVGIKSLQPVGVFLPGTQTYPGGAPFDPAEFSRKPDAFLEQQVGSSHQALLWYAVLCSGTESRCIHGLNPVESTDTGKVSDPWHCRARLLLLRYH